MSLFTVLLCLSLGSLHVTVGQEIPPGETVLVTNPVPNIPRSGCEFSPEVEFLKAKLAEAQIQIKQLQLELNLCRQETTGEIFQQKMDALISCQREEKMCQGKLRAKSTAVAQCKTSLVKCRQHSVECKNGLRAARVKVNRCLKRHHQLQIKLDVCHKNLRHEHQRGRVCKRELARCESYRLRIHERVVSFKRKIKYWVNCQRRLKSENQRLKKWLHMCRSSLRQCRKSRLHCRRGHKQCRREFTIRNRLLIKIKIQLAKCRRNCRRQHRRCQKKLEEWKKRALKCHRRQKKCRKQMRKCKVTLIRVRKSCHKHGLGHHGKRRKCQKQLSKCRKYKRKCQRQLKGCRSGHHNISHGNCRDCRRRLRRCHRQLKKKHAKLVKTYRRLRKCQKHHGRYPNSPKKSCLRKLFAAKLLWKIKCRRRMRNHHHQLRKCRSHLRRCRQRHPVSHRPAYKNCPRRLKSIKKQLLRCRRRLQRKCGSNSHAGHHSDRHCSKWRRSYRKCRTRHRHLHTQLRRCRSCSSETSRRCCRKRCRGHTTSRKCTIHVERERRRCRRRISACRKRSRRCQLQSAKCRRRLVRCRRSSTSEYNPHSCHERIGRERRRCKQQLRWQARHCHRQDQTGCSHLSRRVKVLHSRLEKCRRDCMLPPQHSFEDHHYHHVDGHTLCLRRLRQLETRLLLHSHTALPDVDSVRPQHYLELMMKLAICQSRQNSQWTGRSPMWCRCGPN